MIEFLGFLLGAEIGDKVADKAISGGRIYLNFCKLILSFAMWMLFGQIVADFIHSEGIGLKILSIVAVLALIAGFCYCVYKIETKHIKCSHIYPVICYVVTTFFYGLNFYLEEERLSGWFFLIAVINLANMWLPKVILKRTEKLGKKSALVEIVERWIAKKRT